MRFGDFDAGLAAAQLNNLFGLEPIMARRGLVVERSEDPSVLLFPFDPRREALGDYIGIAEALRSNSLRRVIAFAAGTPAGKTQVEVRNAFSYLTGDQIAGIIQEGVDRELLERQGEACRGRSGKNFGGTLEWYVAFECVNLTKCIAYWGVKLQGHPHGDYDVVLMRETQLGFIECKSGNISSITDDALRMFLRREQILAPQFSVLLIDGASNERIASLAPSLLEVASEDEFTSRFSYYSASGHGSSIRPSVEVYQDFCRLVPTNTFLVGIKDQTVHVTLMSIFRFMSQVCDRIVRFEDTAAKAQFNFIETMQGHAGT